jgi:cytidine deaminase
MCRQVIREFCALDMPILLVPGDYPQLTPSISQDDAQYGGVKLWTVAELLPDSFGPEHLELSRNSS